MCPIGGFGDFALSAAVERRPEADAHAHNLPIAGVPAQCLSNTLRIVIVTRGRSGVRHEDDTPVADRVPYQEEVAPAEVLRVRQ
jgi:hypothetical protein